MNNGVALQSQNSLGNQWEVALSKDTKKLICLLQLPHIWFWKVKTAV